MHSTVICILITCTGLCDADIFSSLAKTRQLVNHIRLSNFTDILTLYIEKRRTWLSYYRILSGTSSEFRQAVLDNDDFDILKPLSAFKYVYMAAEPEKGGNNYIKKIDVRIALLRHLKGFPTLVDLEGIANAILAAQEVHKLSTDDVANGWFRGLVSRPLHFKERFDMATSVTKMTFLRRYDYMAKSVRHIEWLSSTKDVVQTPKEATLLYRPLLNELSSINCSCSLYSHKVFRFLDKFGPHLQLPKNCSETPRERCTIFDQDFRKQFPFDLFEALCRGEVVPGIRDIENRTRSALLKCRYVDNNDPRLILAPIKVEELNHVIPYVALLHDVITDKTADVLKSPRRLRGSTKRMGESGPVKTTRNVKWYNIAEESIDPGVRSSLARLSVFTKLDDEGETDTTVLNYGSAGMDHLHIDVKFWGRVNENTVKNPIVTVKIFLNDIINGGEEVFPLLGIKVEPVKNSALVYYNLYRNGYSNHYAIHGSCPVMYGEKWIARHFIYNHGQEYNYPCNLNPFE